MQLFPNKPWLFLCWPLCSGGILMQEGIVEMELKQERNSLLKLKAIIYFIYVEIPL